jgi:general secretion pathway protein D
MFQRLALARLVRAISILLGAIVMVAMPAGPAAAFAATAEQLRPQPTPVVLTGIRLVSESASESHFELAFDPTATTFAPIASQPTQPSLGFALATRGGQAVQPRGMKGLVRGISFEQIDTVLILRFSVTAAASVSAVQTSGRTIEVTVSTDAGGGGSDYETGGGLPPGGLPPVYDAPPGEDSYELVMLKYADVSEVVGLLSDGITVKSNDVFIPREPGFGSNSLTGNNYVPPATTQAPGSSDEPLGQSIDASMSIDRRLNAIWLKGSPQRIARLKAMIAMIDIPVDSVVLETQMVELSETGQKAIGIDFANPNGQLGVVTLQSGQFIPPGVPAGNRLTSAAFQAALYAEIKKGNGRIVSKPRIAALSGSTAKIITGDALPILTAITLSGVNGVSQQVQYVNVGVTLQIAPRVSADGFVTSHVYAVVSSVTGFSQGYPTISQRQAETAATVRDGDSFVIGGLTQDENINTKSKVPLLGDIPLLGQAFRTDRSTRTKTELYIIVTPHIVHRVGSMALTTPRAEEYDARPVTTVPTGTVVQPESTAPQR